MRPENTETTSYLFIIMSREWVAYSDISSDDAVFLSVSDDGDVSEFSRGNFEWTGPACIKRDKLNIDAMHVFSQIEPFLPLRGIKVRACDIDTYEDYLRAAEFVKAW